MKFLKTIIAIGTILILTITITKIMENWNTIAKIIVGLIILMIILIAIKYIKNLFSDNKEEDYFK